MTGETRLALFRDTGGSAKHSIALVLVECPAAPSHPIGRPQVTDGESHEVLGLLGIASALGLYVRDLATKLQKRLPLRRGAFHLLQPRGGG